MIVDLYYRYSLLAARTIWQGDDLKQLTRMLPAPVARAVDLSLDLMH